MKAILFHLLLLLSLSSACFETNTSLLANSTFELRTIDCLNITDINATIYVENITQNNIINMTAYSTTTNTVTNTTYNCNYDIIGINRSLDYSELYSNAEHQLYLTCKEFPKINQITNITAGNSMSYSLYNLTINAEYKKYNINSTLSYGTPYTNVENNITINPPASPIIENLTVDKCGFAKHYDFGFNIYSPACEDKTIQLKHDESYEVAFFGLKILAPSKLNQSVLINDGETWNNSETGLQVTCNTSLNKFYEFCKNNELQFYQQNWQLVNLTNYTCVHYMRVCADNLTQYCTVEEKFEQKENGIINCWNRNIETMINNTELYRQQKDQCEVERNRLAQGVDALDNLQQENENNMMLGLGIIVFGISLISAVVAYAVKKKKEILRDEK